MRDQIVSGRIYDRWKCWSTRAPMWNSHLKYPSSCSRWRSNSVLSRVVIFRTNMTLTAKFVARARVHSATIFDWCATRAWFRTGGYSGRNPINRKRLFVRMKKSLPRDAPARADKPRRIVSPAAIRQNRNGVNSISRFQTWSTYALSQPLVLALILVLDSQRHKDTRIHMC